MTMTFFRQHLDVALLEESLAYLVFWECLSEAENERAKRRIANLHASGGATTRKRTGDAVVERVKR
ncbi:MAG: hypothetical protein AB7G11_11170 [Phycisphaerales bacterium]